MTTLVQKYGGTSVNGPERIRAVARRIADSRARGASLVVVVSAMGDTTDQLIELAHQVSPRPSRREMDMLLSTGERVSMALLVMALNDLGLEAISFTGSQSGILTNESHSHARIVSLTPGRIRAELERGRVVIVAGFQGVSPVTKEITTLGRGGSDTTAVALAAALAPARCEIYTDVDGVFTADPRVVPEARRIARLSFRACSALAHAGGQVLHARCVDLAARERVPLAVRSSFTDTPGTEIVPSEPVEATVEQPRVEAIAHRTGVSIVLAEGNSGGRGESRGILEAVAGRFPALGLVAHEQAGDEHAALVWVGAREDAEALEACFRELRGPGGEWRLDVQHDCAFVTLVGFGLGAAEAARAEAALEKAGVPIVALRVTACGLVFRVPNDRCETAVRALHAALIG
ncbi:MAG: aspartate kinase [Candidatus Eisenbacteria bacterium]|nr:aspartate kinase [Candidatus Eisenbacteria bacterium]